MKTTEVIHCEACGDIGTIKNKAQSAILRMEHLKEVHPEAWYQLQEARNALYKIEDAITAQYIRVGYLGGLT